MRTPLAAAALAAMALPAAWGQFALSVPDPNGDRPVAAVFDLGALYPTESATARFRLRNASETPALLTILSVRGTGFSISGSPSLPAAVAPGQAVDFAVTFQAGAVASYSAELAADGLAVLLTASVLPRLTYQVGGQPLAAAGIDFGAVIAGGTVSRRVTATNLTASTLAAAAIAITGDAFSIPAAPSGGAPLQPGQSQDFDIVFRPPGAGAWTGTLVIDDRSYPLRGAATGPPLPKPLLSIDGAGLVTVALDSPAKAAGAGTLTLDFTPLAKGAVDSAVQLGVIGRSLGFTIAPGDTRAHFGDLDAVALQTGTTAGTIALAAELGGATDRKEIVIPAAPVAITSAVATRAANSIELRTSGYDNTRSAGAVTFTFFDSSGAPLPAIQVDYTRDFAAYFATSDGGAFLLRSVFPVTGDPAKIAEFAVQMTNSAGSTTTGRVKF